jgi:hypothetical protein
MKAAFPQGAAFFNPALDNGQPSGLDPASTDAAHFRCAHKTTLFEYLEVLNDGGQRYVERSGKAGDGNGALAQPFDDGTARRIAESMKNAVDSGFVRHHTKTPV